MCSTSSCGVGALPSKIITDATCMCAVESSSRCRNVESSAVKRSGLAMASIVAAGRRAVNADGRRTWGGGPHGIRRTYPPSRLERPSRAISSIFLGGLPAHPAERHLLGQTQQPDQSVRARVAARPDRDLRAVRPQHLDDRAHVADHAVVAEAIFERLHLICHYLPDLRCVQSHMASLLLGLNGSWIMPEHAKRGLWWGLKLPVRPPKEIACPVSPPSTCWTSRTRSGSARPGSTANLAASTSTRATSASACFATRRTCAARWRTAIASRRRPT